MRLLKPNRRKAQIATKAKFWCYKCDHCLVGQYGKCGYCGAQQTSKLKVYGTPE